MNTILVCIPCYDRRDSRRTLVRSILTCPDAAPMVCESKYSVVKNKNLLLERARKSSYDYIAFADDDIELTPGWEAMLEGFNVLPNIGQVGPLLLRDDGKVWSAWVDFNGLIPFQAGMGMDVSDGVKQIGTCPALCGAFTIFNRKFLDIIDWKFDDRYSTSQIEDIDQSLTVRESGFLPLYYGECSATHRPANTTPRDCSGNLKLFIDKWTGRFNPAEMVQ